MSSKEHIETIQALLQRPSLYKEERAALEWVLQYLGSLEQISEQARNPLPVTGSLWYPPNAINPDYPSKL